ncbi:MAG TPA: heme lyase CcmF/NrfE family subunit [Longimicrobiales bacterium]|nr:heme lyase CcmF/NrfE family subunit [Longimicrobiales bacterium]
MIRLLGHSAIMAALLLALFGAAIAVLGVRRSRPDFLRSAQLATYGTFALLLIANLSMVYALVTHDFSVGYVAQVGNRSTPLFYTVISLWGALEGSILFWGLVLSGYSAAVVFLNRDRHGSLVPYATATLLVIGAFFYLLLLGPADPFVEVSPVPADGPGPNPLLQNHILMGIHPPLLYLGYVGLSVPFAFAIGAMLSGRVEDGAWLRLTRRWTLAAWGFLSLAIMAGMWWSYEVLGWGGYWAWDPVENASFLPWLTATAFLHSAMVEERRGLLRVWNLSLIVATFLLTIFGTFLTRSGIVASVHAFAEGEIGYWFLSFIALCLVFSLALVLGRSRALRSEGRMGAVASRETVFLLNNLLLTVFTFTVLLGTVYPLVAEAMRGVKVSVGAPFFNRMTLPLIAALLFLLGVGPALPWRATTREELRTRFVAPGLAAAAAIAIAAAFGTRNLYAYAAFAFAGWAAASNLGEFWRGARARMRAKGEGAWVALGRLVRSNGRRYGGYIAHLGVLAMAVGIAASSAFRTEVERTLRPGETLEIEGYRLRFDGVAARDEPRRFVVWADMALLDADGEVADVLQPSLNFYRTSDQPITTPAVRERPHEDLYLVLMAFDRDGANVTIQALVEPLVVWIWIGGGIVGAGALVSLLAGPRSRRPGRLSRADPTRARAPAAAGS